MRFFLSLVLVLSLLIAPIAAMAADHCCVHSHIMSGFSVAGLTNADFAVSKKRPFPVESAMQGLGPQNLLRPPQAA